MAIVIILEKQVPHNNHFPLSSVVVGGTPDVWGSC